MACTVRSVMPAAALMSRIRDPGLRAISTSTCPCPVSSVQPPSRSPGSLTPPDHILARVSSREVSRDIFLMFLLTGLRRAPILVVPPTGPDVGRDGDDHGPRRGACRPRSQAAARLTPASHGRGSGVTAAAAAGRGHAAWRDRYQQ